MVKRAGIITKFEMCEPTSVEDGYVELDREYLLRQQREKKAG
jgi:hypothetical protein